MSENFAKGVTVKTIKKDDWEIIKLGFEHEKFYENPINERGYINIVLKRSKKGEWYAVQDTYKSKEKKDDNADIVHFSESDYDFNQVSIDTSEIPF